MQAGLIFLTMLSLWIASIYLVNHFHLSRRFKLLATTDPLTGCMNRRELTERMQQLDEQTSGALLMLDLDNFKSINDTYGHHAGDMVIKDFSQRLKNHIREQDWVVRFGGEEFVVWLAHIKPVDAIQIAERVREHVESAIVICEGTDIRYTVSIGLTVIDNSSPSLFESWIKTADELLYRAKEAGRNQLVCGAF